MRCEHHQARRRGAIGRCFLAQVARQVDHAQQAAAHIGQAQVPGLGQRNDGQGRGGDDLADLEQVDQVARGPDRQAQLAGIAAGAGAGRLHLFQQLLLVQAQAGTARRGIAPAALFTLLAVARRDGHALTPPAVATAAMLASRRSGSTGLTR